MTAHPSQRRYRLIIAAFLILSGAVIQPAGTLTDASALAAWVPITYMWGLITYYVVAAFGGPINRRIRRWTGMPAEVLAHQEFGRNTGIRN
jgi:hypothetical protein